MSKSKLICVILAVFLLVGTIPLVFGVTADKENLSKDTTPDASVTSDKTSLQMRKALSENASVTTSLKTKEDKLSMAPRNLTVSRYGAEYYDVQVQTIDTVDDTGLTSVILQDSSGNTLGWFWVKCPHDTQELEVYSTLLLSRQLHDSITVYTDDDGYIYRVTY
jgi:hypothetical protein